MKTTSTRLLKYVPGFESEKLSSSRENAFDVWLPDFWHSFVEISRGKLDYFQVKGCQNRIPIRKMACCQTKVAVESYKSHEKIFAVIKKAKIYGSRVFIHKKVLFLYPMQLWVRSKFVFNENEFVRAVELGKLGKRGLRGNRTSWGRGI